MGEVTSTTSIAGLLKTHFQGPINKAVEEDTLLLKMLAPTSKYVMSGAKTIKHPVQLVANTSIGYRDGSTETLPDSAPSDTQQAQTLLKTMYAYIEFYGDALVITKDDKGAFASTFTNEITSAAQTVTRECNRAMYGLGNGVLGQVAVISTNTITIRMDSTSTTTAPNMRWFEKGMYVDILDPATGLSRSARTGATYFRISVRDRATRTLTVTDNLGVAIADLSAGDFTVAAGDYVTVRGNYNKEPYGLEAICDDGTNTSSFLGISETSYDRWRGTLVDNSGTPRELTETMLQDSYDECEIYGKNLLTMTTKDIRNKIARMVKSTMVEPQTLDLKGGFKAISYNGYPVYGDIWAPANKLFTVNLDTIVPHQMKDAPNGSPFRFNAFSFDDLDNQLLHAIRSYDIYWCKGRLMYNMTTKNRCANYMITDINAAL